MPHDHRAIALGGNVEVGPCSHGHHVLQPGGNRCLAGAVNGVWEAIVGAGPVVPVPAEDQDVDAYLTAWDDLMLTLTR